MTLDKFIEKIRYRSLEIIITTSDNMELYNGTIGTYLTSVFRQNNGNKRLLLIYPGVDSLIIELAVRSDQLCEH